MGKEFRQNTSYRDILNSSSDTPENETKEPQGGDNHGNTRLPFGLCKKHGINLPDTATPRDAWNALKGIGITPERVYADLQGKGSNEAPKEESRSTVYKASSIQEAEDYARKIFGVECNYKGISLEVANELNAALKRGIDVCPEIGNNIHFIGSAQQRNKAYKEELTQYYLEYWKEVAPYMPEEWHIKQAKKYASKSVERISVNTIAFASRYVGGENNPRRHISEKYCGISLNDAWAKDPEKLLKALEQDEKAGHSPVGCGTIASVIDHEIGHQLDYALGLRTDSEITALYYKHTKQEIKEGLSIYASTSIGEFVAEAYSEALNNPNPRPIAKAVYKVIERRLNVK